MKGIKNKSTMIMNEEDLKILKRSIEYVKNLNIFASNKKDNKKKSLKKVA